MFGPSTNRERKEYFVSSNNHGGERNPLLEWLAGAIAVFALGAQAKQWITSHEQLIFQYAIWLLKAGCFSAVAIFGTYYVYGLILKSREWVKAISDFLIKIEAQVEAFEQRLSYVSIRNSSLERFLELNRADIKELKKFTKYDQEIQRQEKLKEALVAMGVANPEVSGESDAKRPDVPTGN